MMTTLPLCLLYAVIGTLEDWTVAKFYNAVGKRDRVAASVISTFHTLLAVCVVGSIIVLKSPVLLISYALGGGIGMYAGMGGGKNA